MLFSCLFLMMVEIGGMLLPRGMHVTIRMKSLLWHSIAEAERFLS